MTPPPSMTCSYPSCDFTTPAAIPSYELVLKSLELHINAAHGNHNAASTTRNFVNKVEKPKRPVITTSMSESDWSFFHNKWLRYQRQANLQDQQVTDELWACLDDDMERLAFQDGLNTLNSDELLSSIKRLAVTTLHPSLHVVALHNLSQHSDESTKAFSARVRGVAVNCNLVKQCSATSCTENVSFVNETCYHVVMAGIASAELKEKILTQAMMGTVKDLPTLIEFATAEESAKVKDTTKVAAIVRPQKTSNQQVRKCHCCGDLQHGPYNKHRVSQCKAMGQKCSNC